MPIINRHQFFQTAFGLKEVTEEGQSYFVPIDDEAVPELKDYERLLSASRKAAFSAFSKKVEDKMSPVFTQADITQPLQQKYEMDYAMELLESLELTCLAQAIVDDDRDTVKAMLEKKPELLLFKPDVIVTSDYTGQRFSVDGNFLGLACRRKQIEMVKIITPYFDKLIAGIDTDTEEYDEEIARVKAIKNAGLAQWLKYPTDANGEIQVPVDYQAIIEDLIKVFESETIAAGTADFRTLSTNIETAMETLYNHLIPNFKEEDISKRHVFTKQNHLDVELLLYAAYKAYDTHFNLFQSWEQRDAYCIRVIGILQNSLPPETAKIFCEGIYSVVEENSAISGRAAELKLKDGTSFYCGADFALRSGLVFEFLALVGGRRGRRIGESWRGCVGGSSLGNLFQTKTTIFRELYDTTNSTKPINRTANIINAGV